MNNLDQRNDNFIHKKSRFSYSISCAIMLITYIVTLGISYVLLRVFEASVSDKILRYFIVDLIATGIVFFFSFSFKNSSLYDPYWWTIPIGMALYLFINLGNYYFFSIVTIILMSLYTLRHLFNYARSWSGFTHEDFRYLDFKKKLTEYMWLYWPLSFFGFHIFPTLLTYTASIPFLYIFYTDNPHIYALIIIGFITSFIGIIIEYYADNQLP